MKIKNILALIFVLGCSAVLACNSSSKSEDPVPNGSIADGSFCREHAECESGVCSSQEADIEASNVLCLPDNCGVCIACSSNTQCATEYCNTQTGKCEEAPAPTGGISSGECGAPCNTAGDCHTPYICNIDKYCSNDDRSC